MNDPVQYRYASERIGFYIASSDQDMLAQVGRLLSRSGYVGIMDTAGRLQYLVDGRRGPPHAARRIAESADRMIEGRMTQADLLRQRLGPAADQVLSSHDIRPELKGHRYIRYMLLQAGADETRLRPVSKTAYPAAAAFFRVSVAQVERDVRYALLKTDLRRMGLTASSSVCRLHGEMLRLAEQQLEKEIPLAVVADNEGYY